MVVAGCFLVLNTTSALAFYGLAVYLNLFSREKGWDVSSISLATTLFFVVSGLFGLITARLMARYDARAVVVAGGVIGAVALALLGQVDEKWQLYVVYALFAIGFSAGGLIPLTTVVTRWYHKRRSIALAVASTGLSVGGVFLTPISKSYLDNVGLSKGTPVLALVWLVGTVPVALFMIKPDPGRYGWMPDGERVQEGRPAPPPAGIPFPEAIRTRFFMCTTAAYMLMMGSQVGGIQQIIKLVEERTSAETATYATVFLSGTSIFARLLGGRLASRLPLIGFTAILGAVQAVALTSVALASTTVILFASIVLFGATIGNLLMLQPLIIAERFGVLDYPAIYGRGQFFTMFGTAGGPLLMGWLYDNAGGYDTAYAVGAVGSLIGACVLASGGPVTQRSGTGATSTGVPTAIATVSDS